MTDEERRRRFLLNTYAAYGAAGQDERRVDSISGSILTFNTKYAAPLVSLKLNIEPVQLGSGDPSPDNVRPITGWTGANVYRTGKNMIPERFPDTSLYNVTFINNDDGTISTSGTATRSASTLTARFKLPIGSFIMSGCPVGGGNSKYYMRLLAYDGSTLIGSYTDVGNGISFINTNANYEWVAIIAVDVNQSAPSAKWYPMIRIAGESSEFEKINGTKVPITWQGSAGNVYGAVLDVNTGILTVDKGYCIISDLTWTYDTTYNRFRSNSLVGNIKPSPFNSSVADILCSYLTKNSVSARIDKTIAVASSGNIIIYDSAYNTVSDFVSNRGIQQIVYELLNPQIYQLTPTQITTLIGTNNLWADAGTLEAEYIR